MTPYMTPIESDRDKQGDRFPRLIGVLGEAGQ